MYNQQSKKHDRFKKEVASVMKKTIVMDGATRMNYSRCGYILMWMIVNIFDGLSSFPSSSFLLWMLAFALGLLDLMCLTKNMNNVCIICFRQVVYALDYFVEKIKLYDCSQWCRRNVSLSCRCRRNIVRCNTLRDSCRTNAAAMDVSGLDQEIEVGSIVAWKNLQKRRARHRFGYGVLLICWFKFMAVVCFAMQVVVVNGYPKMPDGCKGKDWDDRTCDLKEAIDELIALNADGSGTHSTYGPVAEWDMSLVTDLSYAFSTKGSFNGDISKWQTQNVKSMRGSK